MANNITVQYVAEAQAGAKSKFDKQPVRGGNYLAQGQLDHKPSQDVDAKKPQRQSVQYRPLVVADRRG